MQGLKRHPILSLWDEIPDLYFFVKDRSGRFVDANLAFAKRCGKKVVRDVVGLCDHEVWPHHLASLYLRDDEVVLQKGKPILNRMELIQRPQGGADWFLTTKVPMVDENGKVLGLAGVSRDIHKSDTLVSAVREMAPALDMLLKDYAGEVNIRACARKVGLSLSQFERRFKGMFQMSPTAYLQKIRLQAACLLLSTTDISISEIGRKTGFYDNSHFTRNFFKAYGQGPREFRKEIKR